MPDSLFSSREPSRNEDKTTKSPNLVENIVRLPPAVGYFILGIVTAVSAVRAYGKFGKRIKNSEWVSKEHTLKKQWIKGVVTSVGDADNFRLYHTTAFGYNWPFRFRRVPTLSKDLKNETIHIRIAGIDAPEGAHFGKPGQLYYTEALAWLREQVLHRRVYCQLLRRDQYGRIVAHVRRPLFKLPGFLFHGKNIAAEMLKAGWAVTYDQAGAEYGHLGKQGYLQLENQAKHARRGMWKDGEVRDTPAAYKRRHAERGLEAGQVIKSALASGPVRSRSKKSSRVSWFRKWL